MFHLPLLVLQFVGKPVPAKDATLGEHLARGLHLPVHVTPLPNPLCGTPASKWGGDPGLGRGRLAGKSRGLTRLLCVSAYLPDHTAEFDPVADGAENLLACDSNG